MIRQLILGEMDNNCFLATGLDSKTLYIIDPSCDAPGIIRAAEREFKFERAVILLTHAHADHFGALKEVAKELNVEEIMLNPADHALYLSPLNTIMPYWPHQENLPVTTPAVDTAEFSVIATPGHTKGGVCYYFKDLNALFTGDTLFYRSVGRTDLPGGSATELTNSIRQKLFTLPENTIVYPGHGPQSTIGDEVKANPYV